jgi:hypothetical protein
VRYETSCSTLAIVNFTVAMSVLASFVLEPISLPFPETVAEVGGSLRS